MNAVSMLLDQQMAPPWWSSFFAKSSVKYIARKDMYSCSCTQSGISSIYRHNVGRVFFENGAHANNV
jgi:hypothetical protein